MPSTSAPSELEAIVHDGETAAAHPARARLTAEGLTLLREGAEPEPLIFSDLWLGDRAPGRHVLRHAARPDWRLVLLGDVPPGWRKQLRRSPRPSPRRVALWGGAAAVAAGLAAALVLNGGAILAALAPLLPYSWTEPFGRQMVRAVGGGHECSGQAGLAALRHLADRLRPAGGLAEPVTLHVIESPVDNAFALPGGHVVLFSGLIGKAKSPEEVAGVLAHELGHVHHRHPNQRIIRQFSAGVVLRALGGDVGVLADTTLSLGHSRDAEREADTFAIARLREARISPQALADYFARHEPAAAQTPDGSGRLLRETLRKIGDYASTHPAMASRAARFRAAAGDMPAPRPALDADEWQAVRAVCAHPGRTHS